MPSPFPCCPVNRECSRKKTQIEKKMGMKIGMIFSFLLTFYHKLVLREGIFETAAFLIRYFAIHKL